jgi:Na+-driven multidrug efflux pump
MQRAARSTIVDKRTHALLTMACAALVASGSIGCATSFEPRSPHIAIVRGQFSRGYVKDGVHYDGGPFGGEVGEAVKGVPEAERHTDAYAALSTAGSITIFGSEGLAIGASVVAATVDKGEARDATQIGLIIGSAVALVTGVVLHVMAEPHLYDAANIYNADLDRRTTRPAPRLSAPSELTR